MAVIINRAQTRVHLICRVPFGFPGASYSTAELAKVSNLLFYLLMKYGDINSCSSVLSPFIQERPEVSVLVFSVWYGPASR